MLNRRVVTRWKIVAEVRGRGAAIAKLAFNLKDEMEEKDYFD